jgi:long-chain acyl-CoA synthetase
MTETTALVTLNHPFKIARGSIGKPLAGREVQIGADGEILVRGDSIASQVWQHGGLQAREAGWLATGDLATRNDAGRAGLCRAQERRHRHFRGIEYPSPGSGGGVAQAAGVRDALVVALTPRLPGRRRPRC